MQLFNINYIRPRHCCCSPSTVSRTQEGLILFYSSVWGTLCPQSSFGGFIFIPCLFQLLWSVDKNKFPSLLVFTLSHTVPSCCSEGMKMGLCFFFFFWLKPLKVERFSAVKVDSHQKGIKGPISASMCRVLFTVPHMKCFLLLRLLLAHVLVLFSFCSYYCQPRLPGGFCTL